MHVVRRILLSTTILAAGHDAAAGAQQLGTVELGAFVHYTSVNNDAQLGGQTTGFGARGGVFLSKYFEGEIEYGRGTVKTSGIRYTDNAWFPTRIFGVVNLPVGTRTKVLLGAGTVDTYKGDVTNNEFEEGWSLLAGARICFGDAWSLRPELVYDHTPSPSWMQRNYLDRVPGNPTSSRVGFRIGVSRYFGRGSASCIKAPAMVPPPASAPVVSAAPVRTPAPPVAGPAPVQSPPPTPAPQPQAPAPRSEPPRELFRLSGVHFDFDKATLKPEGRIKLDSAVMILSQHSDLRVEIQGHTDSIGTEAYNMSLSERRANAVKAYLTSKGIADSRLVTRGYGKSQPETSNATRDGRAQNRRVVLVEIRN